MSRKYMDFAPRRNGKNGVQSGRAIASPSDTLKAARPSLRSSGKAIARPLGQQSELRPAQMPVEIREESQLVTRAEEMAAMEDYWAGELGAIEDLETGVTEEMGAVITEEEEVKSESAVKTGKPKDDRVGFKDGKSPFINTEKLEKRPLSAFRRGSKGPMPTKNSYAEQVKVAEEKSDVPTMVVTGASKRSTFSLVFVILLVSILGAAVGFVVYLAFFQ